MLWNQVLCKTNKKVLLRERKRHTARCVVSTPSVVLTGYPPPPDRVPPRGGTWPGTPPGGVPRPPLLPHGILGNVAKHYGIWVPPPGVDRQTKWNYYLPVVLRTRAVIITLNNDLFIRVNLWKCKNTKAEAALKDIYSCTGEIFTKRGSNLCLQIATVPINRTLPRRNIHKRDQIFVSKWLLYPFLGHYPGEIFTERGSDLCL